MIKARGMKWAGHVARVVEEKREWKSPLGRPKFRRDDNIKTCLKDAGYEGVDWIQLAQYKDQWRALVSTVKNFRDP
jgi:hypothetical protein